MQLTKKVIRDHIVGRGAKEPQYIVVAIMGIGFFAMGIICLVAKFYSGCFLGVLGAGLMLYELLKARNIASDFNGLYFLCEDTCVEKHCKAGDSETPDVYELHFLKYGKVRLNAPLTNTRMALLFPSYIYDDAQTGDKFYLLCGTDGKVRYVLNRKRWEISENDFLEKNGEYLPK